jgi:hypothetical protein
MPGRKTPRELFDLDLAFFDRPRIKALAPDVPTALQIFVVILWEKKRFAWAKRVIPAKRGMATLSLSRVAELSRSTEDDVRRVVDSAVQLKLVERVGRPHKNPDEFTLRFPGEGVWELKDPGAKRRQRLSRETRAAQKAAKEAAKRPFWPDP